MFIKDCMPCLGLGYYGSDPADLCTTCQGSGATELEGSREDYQGCWLCCGTGYGGVSVRSVCKTCKGTGLCAFTHPQFDSRIVNGNIFIWIAAHGMAELQSH